MSWVELVLRRREYAFSWRTASRTNQSELSRKTVGGRPSNLSAPIAPLSAMSPNSGRKSRRIPSLGFSFQRKARNLELEANSENFAALFKEEVPSEAVNKDETQQNISTEGHSASSDGHARSLGFWPTPNKKLTRHGLTSGRQPRLVCPDAACRAVTLPSAANRGYAIIADERVMNDPARVFRFSLLVFEF